MWLKIQTCHRPPQAPKTGAFSFLSRWVFRQLGAFCKLLHVRGEELRFGQSAIALGGTFKGLVGEVLLIKATAGHHFLARDLSPNLTPSPPHRNPPNTPSHQHYFSSTSPLFLHFNSVILVLAFQTLCRYTKKWERMYLDIM